MRRARNHLPLNSLIYTQTLSANAPKQDSRVRSCTKHLSECTIHFFLVRHGETDWNALQRIQGHQDVPLNGRGLAQAEAVGRYFMGRRIDALYCSDLVRAQQTAAPIAATLNLQAMQNANLRERNYGRCEGLTREQLVSDYLEDAHALKSHHPDYVLPGGESLNQHRQRIVSCLEQLIACHAGQTIVVVTHGGVLDLIYRHTKGMALDKPRNFPIPNAGINLLTVNNGQWSIQLWAETKHLGEQSCELSRSKTQACLKLSNPPPS